MKEDFSPFKMICEDTKCTIKLEKKNKKKLVR